MIPSPEIESKIQNLFPPREIPTIQYQLPILQEARRSLELKSALINRFQNRLFNVASNAKLTEEERKAVRKDQKSYIKMFTNDLYKKFPAELFLSERQLRGSIRENKVRDIEEKGKEAPGKRTLKKLPGQKKTKYSKQQQKNQAVELNREQSDRSQGVVDEFGQISQLDDGEDDNNYDEQGREYQNQI